MTVLKGLGHRRGFLLTIGIIQLMLGWSTIVAPTEAVQMYVLAGHIDTFWCGLVQLILGGIATFTAFWPPGFDKYGFMAAVPAPIFWGVDSLLSMAFQNMPWEVGVRGATIWIGYAVLVLLGSGMVGVGRGEPPLNRPAGNTAKSQQPPEEE
ncbi:hypothetical protein [Streptomyces sp. NPDC015131]|uniref:hypothetical protein n=1 Tax=Streptomyces sp. NPDC015131 TaxID=3364941 RepID=UPI0036F75D5B